MTMDNSQMQDNGQRKTTRRTYALLDNQQKEQIMHVKI